MNTVHGWLDQQDVVTLIKLWEIYQAQLNHSHVSVTSFRCKTYAVASPATVQQVQYADFFDSWYHCFFAFVCLSWELRLILSLYQCFLKHAGWLCRITTYWSYRCGKVEAGKMWIHGACIISVYQFHVLLRVEYGRQSGWEISDWVWLICQRPLQWHQWCEGKSHEMWHELTFTCVTILRALTHFCTSLSHWLMEYSLTHSLTHWTGHSAPGICKNK